MTAAPPRARNLMWRVGHAVDRPVEVVVSGHKSADSDPVFRRRYTFAEVGRLTGAGGDRIRHWVARDVGSSTTDPTRTGADSDGEDDSRAPIASQDDANADRRLSFIGLVHLAVVAAIHARGISMQAIHRGEARCRTVLGAAHPFATRAFRDHGIPTFVGPHGRRPAMGGTSILDAMEKVIVPTLDAFDYGAHVAERWWPLGRACPIVVDPTVHDGVPIIVPQTIRVRDVVDLAENGTSPLAIADSLAIDVTHVEVALAFMDWQGRARRA